MNGLPLDIRTQFRAQGLVGNQIDVEPRQVFQVELHAEVAGPSKRTRMSMSLSGVVSPRAIDPKSAISATPKRWTMTAL